MRSRWRFLLCCSLVTLIAFTWLFGEAPKGLPLLGLIATIIVGGLGTATGTSNRWPAALALICIAPMGQALYPLLARLAWLPIGAVLKREVVFLGLLGAMLGAIYLLLVPPPSVPEDRLPRARAV